MADQKHSRADTVDHVVEILKKDVNAAYGAVVKQAKAAGHHVYPLIMGLAKNKLGLGKNGLQAVTTRPAVGGPSESCVRCSGTLQSVFSF